MTRAWPFLIAAVICAYLGVAPEPESIMTGPTPSRLGDPWVIASCVFATLFLLVAIFGNRGRK